MADESKEDGISEGNSHTDAAFSTHSGINHPLNVDVFDSRADMFVRTPMSDFWYKKRYINAISNIVPDKTLFWNCCLRREECKRFMSDWGSGYLLPCKVRVAHKWYINDDMAHRVLGYPRENGKVPMKSNKPNYSRVDFKTASFWISGTSGNSTRSVNACMLRGDTWKMLKIGNTYDFVISSYQLYGLHCAQFGEICIVPHARKIYRICELIKSARYPRCIYQIIMFFLFGWSL